MNHPIARRPHGASGLSVFDEDFFRPWFWNGDSAAPFRVDVRDEGDYYLMEAELPGLDRKDIKIDIDDGLLTISAQWNRESAGKKQDYLMNERRCGRISRSFTLENVEEDRVTADYRDGMVLLTLPKREDVRRVPRRIELN